MCGTRRNRCPPVTTRLEWRRWPNGSVAIVTLAAGVGSRWTQGAGVVKALHPFCKLSGKHRTFIEVHLSKSRRVGRQCGQALPHVITTSYLTHAPLELFLRRENHCGYEGPLFLSPGRAVGLRLVPMVRDLRFCLGGMPQQLLDEQAQKVRGKPAGGLDQLWNNTGVKEPITSTMCLCNACIRSAIGLGLISCATASWLNCSNNGLT